MNAHCMQHAIGDERGGDYPLRRLARAFAYIGVAAIAYAAALLAIAVQTSIIEF